MSTTSLATTLVLPCSKTAHILPNEGIFGLEGSLNEEVLLKDFGEPELMLTYTCRLN